jgi:Bacterial membrane protein YfhO
MIGAASLASGAARRAGAKKLIPYLVTALALTLVSVVLFKEFLWRGRFPLYVDIGADSLNDYYPTFVHLSDYIRREGFPSWSFSVGMGQSIFYLAGELIWEPVVWLPKRLIADALIFQYLLKTLISGLIFFRFLQIRGLNFCSSLLGSLFLAFSAYMCMGSCWIINADEVVGFTFLLFAAESAVSSGRWFYLPFAVALLGLITVFHLFLAALALIFYVPSRLIEIHGSNPRTWAWAATQIGVSCLIGVGLAAVIWIGSLHCILNTPRGSGTIPNFAFAPPPTNIFHLESLAYYVTAGLRPFSNDILGSGDRFRGWENYFEAPAAYCGLLTLLAWPQVFLTATKRERVIGALFLVIILIPVIFPWFRYALWLFKGGYFRTFSLFSIFGFTLLSMRALSAYQEERRLNYWVLAGTLLTLLAFLYLPIPLERACIDPIIRHLAAITLGLLGVTLAAGQFFHRQKLAGWIAVLISLINLVYFDGLTVNRPTLHKDDVRQRKGYNDHTIEALLDVKATHEHGFFRINKTWGSGLANRISYNDAMVFGYYGTMSYSSFNNLDYIKFLLGTEAIPADNLAIDAQWSTGLLWEPLLSAFACEKFLITLEPTLFAAADYYELIDRYGDIYMFRNTAFVPLGISFDSSFPEEAFSQMPKWSKQRTLLHAVVLGDEARTPNLKIKQIHLDELEQQFRDLPDQDAVAHLRSHALSLTSWHETRITGNVSVDHDSVLLFQMPFDDGWHARVDGKSRPVLRADIGLLGIPLLAGAHSIELFYSPPLLYLGAGVSIVTALVFVVLSWRWPRIVLRTPATP